MDAQQELFTALKLGLEAKGYAVFDGALPPDDTPYPFLYLGNFRENDTAHKIGMTGSVFPIVHVWSNNVRKRGELSRMILDVKIVYSQIRRTKNHAWNARGITSQILSDYTTKTPLLHGIVEAEFLFS